MELKAIVRSKIFSLLSLALVFNLVTCSADDESDASNDAGGGELDPEQLLQDNPLTAAYPSTLAISVFPQSTTASLALLQDEKVDLSSEEKKRPAELAEDRQKVLQGGEGVECFPAGMLSDRKGESVSCYEFDNDMNPFNNGPAGEGGTADGKHSSGEACLVAFARQEVLDATQYVDRALNTVAGMLCAVKKAGGDTTLPASGEEKDFLDELEDSTTRLNFHVAKMKNLGDDVYRTHIGIGRDGKKFDMILVYKKGSENGENSGVISYKRSKDTLTLQENPPPGQNNPPPGGNQQDSNNTENMNQYVSVKFAQVHDDEGNLRNRSEVRMASMVNTIDGFDSQGIVDFAVIPDNAGNETANNIKYVQFDIDAETAEGDISYWRNPGGSLNESARGFVFNIEANEESGALAGCGASGASNVSIRGTFSSDSSTATDALKPTRYWHPFANNNTHPDKDDRYTADQGPFITTQCFLQNTTSGIYEIDYDKTKSLSDTTDEAKITARGYDVIPQETGNGFIKPPKPPEQIPEGEFKPEE